MRVTRRTGAPGVLLGALAAIVLVVATATPARADGWWGDVDCAQLPAPICDVGVGRPGRPGGPGPGAGNGGSAGDGPPCTDVPAGPGWVAIWTQQHGPVPDDHTIHLRMCDGSDVTLVALGPAGPQATPPTVEELARAAYARLHLPEPGIRMSPAGDQLVGLPVWLWVGSWAPVSATAAMAGVAVTATAVPREVRWQLGDGARVVCSGPGTPYHAGSDPAAASPDCGYVYRRSSAGRPRAAFEVRATVRWSVSWSGAGQSGTAADLSTTSTGLVRVAESQAVVIAAR